MHARENKPYAQQQMLFCCCFYREWKKMIQLSNFYVILLERASRHLNSSQMQHVLWRKTLLTSLEGKTVSKRFSLAALTSLAPQERHSLWSHKYQTFYNLNYTDIFLFSSTGQLPLRRSRPPSRCQALLCTTTAAFKRPRFSAEAAAALMGPAVGGAQV